MMRLASWVIAVLALIATIQLSVFSYHFFQPAADLLALKVENPIVRYGDSLIVNQTYIRRDWCEVDIDRFIVNSETRMLMRRERLPAGILPLGTGIIRTSIPTKLPSNSIIPLGIADPAMSDLTPGRYTLMEVLHYKCELRANNTIPSPLVTFEVTP